MSDSKEGVLEVVAGLEGEKIVHIAAGAEHSVLVTGTIYRHYHYYTILAVSLSSIFFLFFLLAPISILS